MTTDLRFGVVGLGNMGSVHARLLAEGKIGGAVLSAACDLDAAKLERWRAHAACFADCATMLRSAPLDVLVVATPHYSHAPLSILGFEQGLHVLTEKPLAVHLLDALRMRAAYQQRPKPEQKWLISLGLRAEPRALQIKRLLAENRIGRLQRIHWVACDWFRTQAYYDSSPWRGTWRGEGGGVLLNQAHHQLDLWCWLFGLPKRVQAFCQFGKYHKIEVEDEVVAYLEYDAGLSGVFITSTGEAPGTSRLEIVGDAGTIRLEGTRLHIERTWSSVAEQRATGAAESRGVESWFSEYDIPPHPVGVAQRVLDNLVATIFDKQPPLADFTAGLQALELTNALLCSGLIAKPVELPLDANQYAGLIAARCQ